MRALRALAFLLIFPSDVSAEPIQDVDKPACLAARHAIEQAGVLTFDHVSPNGSSIFYKDVGDVGSVLICIIDPSLSLNIDDWSRKDPSAKSPPKRLIDLLANQGALATASTPSAIRSMAKKCMTEAFADRQYSIGEIHEGSMEVDCEVFRDRGGGAVFSVTRRSDG